METRITTENCDVLITAEEAFCAFENAVLNAQNKISAGFRIFDMMTRLHSEAGRDVGRTWFDLLAYKLDQGVSVSLKLSDFDPVVATDLHAGTWRTMRQASALREVTRHPEKLHVEACMHEARIGRLSSVALWAKARATLAKHVARYNEMDTSSRKDFLHGRPGLMPFLQLDASGKARPRLWPPAQLVPTSHHQKLAVIDGRHVYIGGLDLDDRRYDTKDHEQRPEQTWHDVQVLIDDTNLAEAAERHLDVFDSVSSGGKVPPMSPHFLRTLSTARRTPVVTLSPNPQVREIRQAHLDHIATATDLIYLETQFLRDTDITQALCEAAARAPELGLVVILPAAPEEVAFDNSGRSDARYGEFLQAKCVDRLCQAFGSRFFAGAPVKPEKGRSDDRGTLHDAPVLYVHAKVSIFDDRAAIVSSANLNGRSMNWDTEAGVELTDQALVRHLKERCIRHWLPNEELPAYLSGKGAVGHWQALAEKTADTTPEARKTFIVPYKISPARRFGRKLPGVPEEMV